MTFVDVYVAVISVGDHSITHFVVIKFLGVVIANNFSVFEGRLTLEGIHDVALHGDNYSIKVNQNSSLVLSLRLFQAWLV